MTAVGRYVAAGWIDLASLNCVVEGLESWTWGEHSTGPELRNKKLQQEGAHSKG